MIDRNKIWKIKNDLETYYTKFLNHHQLILNLLEDVEYITDDNSENFHNILKEYKKDMLMFDKVFNLFERHERQIKMLIQDDVGILKKKRQDILTQINSKMKGYRYDDGLPF